MTEQYGWHDGACLADFTVCKVQGKAGMALSPSEAGEGLEEIIRVSQSPIAGYC
jgi:hypothetical protein